MDNRGATFIPMRALISIIMVGIIVALAFIGLQHAMKIQAEKQVKRECDELVSYLSTLVSGGYARDVDNPLDIQMHTRSIELKLPDDLVYIGFGIDPDENNDGILRSGLTANGSCIFYKIEGLSKKVIWLDEDFKFREGNFDDNRWLIKTPQQGYIIDGGGDYILTFELVKKAGMTYILVHSEDIYNP